MKPPTVRTFWKFTQIFFAEALAAGIGHYFTFLIDTTQPNVHVVAGFAAGASIYLAIWCAFGTSGAQINPAVTLAALITRRMPIYLAPLYIIADFAGTIVAMAVAYSVTPYLDQAPGTYGMTLPGKDISDVVAVFTEAGTTFVLIVVILASLDEIRAPEWRPEHGAPFPLAVMLTLAVNVITTLHVSGASMNPTRSIAAAIIQNNYDRQWIYFAGPFLGSAVASLFYDLVICPRASLHRTKAWFCKRNFDRHIDYNDETE